MLRRTVLSWVVLAVVQGACAPVAGPVTVEALVPDADARGGVAFGDVTLLTVEDLSTGAGRDFDVRGALRVNMTDVDALSEDDFDEMVARIRGDGGVDVAPRMSFDGERYVADDFETLYYFTLYANFETAFARARAAGDDSDATARKSIVGMFATVQFSEFLPVPLLSSDNAAFAGILDGWLALRTGIQDGVPLAMHRGVIAHEFGHRLFFHNVFRRVDGGFEHWRDDLVSSNDPRSDEEAAAATRRHNLLSGLDEGLADVFAIGALLDKDAVTDAFVGAGAVFLPEAARRDVEGDYARAATYDGLRTLELDSALLRDCGIRDAEFESDFNFYCVGTVVAAALWEAAGRDAAVLHEEIEPAVLRAMPAVGEALVNGEVFDLDIFLEALAREIAPGARRDALCAAYAARFASLVAVDDDTGMSRIPSCL